MKKIKNVSIFFLLLGFFAPLYGNAQEKIWSDSELTCPRYHRIAEVIGEDQAGCSASRSGELLAPTLLMEESSAFYTDNLTRLHRDNQSDPNQAAHMSIRDLRKHHECLRQICYEIFRQCTPNQKDFRETLDPARWCNQKTYELFEIAKTATFTGIDENFARKRRSLEKQKWNAIATRFDAYLQHWLPYNVNRLKQFANKVYVFIRNPF